MRKSFCELDRQRRLGARASRLRRSRCRRRAHLHRAVLVERSRVRIRRRGAEDEPVTAAVELSVLLQEARQALALKLELWKAIANGQPLTRTIMQDFRIDTASAGWLVTSYLITMAAVQPIAGKLGDRFLRIELADHLAPGDPPAVLDIAPAVCPEFAGGVNGIAGCTAVKLKVVNGAV